MANRRVSVWKYVKIGTNWRYCKPVYGANNKIKPHWVYVKGVPEEHTEGNFYIMHLDGQRKIWKLIGPNPVDALRAAQYESRFKSDSLPTILKQFDRWCQKVTAAKRKAVWEAVAAEEDQRMVDVSDTSEEPVSKAFQIED
jgi:hypothetical protein